MAIIQKANSLSGQNLISVLNLCQFVGMCSATCPAPRHLPLFYLQENSTLNKQSIKQSWSKQETLLQSENPTRFSGSSELGMVGSGNATPLHHCTAPVIPPTSRCENSSNSSLLGWGATMGLARIASSWEWERLWSHINRKELQICFIAPEYFVPHLTDIHVQLSVDNTAVVSHVNHAGGTLGPKFCQIWQLQFGNGVYRERFIFQQFTYQVL